MNLNISSDTLHFGFVLYKGPAWEVDAGVNVRFVATKQLYIFLRYHVLYYFFVSCFRTFCFVCDFISNIVGRMIMRT